MSERLNTTIHTPSQKARNHGTALLSAMVAAEIFADASPAQAHGFYHAVGRRIAGFVDLGENSDIDLLTSHMNRLWDEFGWGQVSLEIADKEVLIRHEGMPEGIDGDVAGHWPDLATALLEGIYDAWFRSLGSDEALSTKVVSWNEGVVELRHGT